MIWVGETQTDADYTEDQSCNLVFSSFSLIWAQMEMEMGTLFLSASAVLSFTLMFFAIYFSSYFFIFKNWGSSRYQAASCLMSLAHGSPAVILALYSLLENNQDLSQLNFAAENTSLQDMVLEFSIGYFIVDLSHYMIFIPTDVLFIAHHLATLYVLCSCRYVIHHGAVSILVLLVLAEITSPCHNTWSLARYRKVDLPEAARYYEFLSPIFFTTYSVVRGVLAPLYAFKLGLIFLSGAAKGLIPIWGLISWMVVIVTAIGISIMWVLNQWIGLYNRRANELKKVN
jgi:hypothetical protein